MAEFVEVMRQRAQMCKQYKYCYQGCILADLLEGCGTANCMEYAKVYPAEFESAVMTWAKNNPEKTMKDVFFEKFPNAPRDELGDPRMCPLDVGFPARPDGAGFEGECHTEEPCTGCWNRPAPEE